MNGIPWRLWLRAATRLGVTPREFWRLSVVEWLAILNAADRTALSRADLARLMGAFPDKEAKDG